MPLHDALHGGESDAEPLELPVGVKPLERAEQYPELLDIVRRLVKPERDKLKRERRRQRWWIYGENTPGLYSRIRPLRRSRTSLQYDKVKLGRLIQERLDPDILVQAQARPKWTSTIEAVRERLACRAERRAG